MMDFLGMEGFAMALGKSVGPVAGGGPQSPALR
jgi:hypothetical protein